MQRAAPQRALPARACRCPRRCASAPTTTPRWRHARDGLLVIATPMAALRERLAALPAGHAGAVAVQGLRGRQRRTGPRDRARRCGPGAPAGVLSGPSFALEVARGQPTALVAASSDAALCEAAVQAFHSDTLRVYTLGRPGRRGGRRRGEERAGHRHRHRRWPGGARGAAHRPGLNARAALITRGLAEMTRLGVALGARAETFMGLSGLGDLVLTATGDLSRNRRVGLLLAQGLALAGILRSWAMWPRACYSAPTRAGPRPGRWVCDMPITAGRGRRARRPHRRRCARCGS